jgi:AraC-like DNA-binding protein
MQYIPLAPQKFLNALLDQSVAFDMITYGKGLAVQDWHMGPRKVSDHLLIGVCAGGLRAELGKKKFPMGNNTLIWVQPGANHHIFQSPDVRQTVKYYARFTLAKNKPLRLKEDYLFFPEASRLLLFFEEIVLTGNLVVGGTENTRLRTQLASFFSHVLDRAVPASAEETRGLSVLLRNRALNFIHENISRHFKVEEAAAHCNLTHDYFARQFKLSFGASPISWIKKERVRLAADFLLETPLSISEVAVRVGYNDIFLFSRQFKEVTGQSPRRWRERKQ